VLFKDHPNVHNQLADLLIEKQYEQGRLYPVPDGYEIKIETYSIYNGKDNPSIEYAILVPKEEIMAEKFWSNIEKSYAHVKQPTIKQPTSIEENKWCDSCGKRTTWINGECENYKNKSSIEEAADKSFTNFVLDNHPDPDYLFSKSLEDAMPEIEKLVNHYIMGKDNKSLDQASEHYYATLTRPLADEKGLVETAFVCGATSPEAKEYWFEQFKQEKK